MEIEGPISQTRAIEEEYPPLPREPPPKGEPPRRISLTTSRSLNTAAALAGDPIAPSLGVDYPFPPYLEYAYPPPDGNILTNIVNALIAIPRFYTQVLHLMNKMNLPAPFRPALPMPPLPPSAPLPEPMHQAGDSSSEESELESSEEEENNEERNMAEDSKTYDRAKQKGPARKRTKREAILGPAIDKGASHEAAGVKTIILPKAPMAIKKKHPILQIKIATKNPSGEGSQEKDKPEVAPQMDVAEDPTGSASMVELEAGKLDAGSILSLPMFKNYAPGSATQVLYIKNLAKDVIVDDLHYVYGAFFSSASEARAKLSVNLMQEGRMRGQAFVTFPTLETAQDALAGSHGYVLKGKPMIVQFGRNQAPSRNPLVPTSK